MISPLMLQSIIKTTIKRYENGNQPKRKQLDLHLADLSPSMYGPHSPVLESNVDFTNKHSYLKGGPVVNDLKAKELF